MPYFPPHRQGITSRARLRGYDYATPGLYFLTVCIHDWSYRLGSVSGDVFHPTAAGLMVERHIGTIPVRFPNTTLDAWCLMPNHAHLIVGIGVENPSSATIPSIASIMNWFKSTTTVEYIRGVRAHGWSRFHKHLWLDGYHDHIIRDERDLQRIREYIEANAANWPRDRFYS